MVKISKADKEHFLEMRALTKDSKGNEVLVGLTVDETEFYLSFSEQNQDSYPSSQDRKKYIELSDKHNIARLAIVSAEIELREDNPSRH